MTTKITNVAHLIDAVVRQTMVLIAQLATAGGQRAKLAKVANKVFLDLVGELESQGVGQKVIADMFGLALRTYQRRRQRLEESVTEKGRSLWEAVLEFVQENGETSRRRVLERFRYDDEDTVRGVLNDLVESALLVRSGYAETTTFRPATADDSGVDPTEVLASIAWVALHQSGAATASELAASLSVSDEAIATALDRLVVDGRVVESGESERSFSCEDYVIPYGSETGWAGAVFDHYQAVVGAICAKLRASVVLSQRTDEVGGSTFHFDICEGHPMETEVVGLLGVLRDQVHTLRDRVEAYNKSAQSLPELDKRVVVYLGQNVIRDEEPPL